MRYVWTTIGGLVIILASLSWWVLDTVNRSAGSATEGISLSIAKGAGVRDISASLAKEKLVRSPQAWTLYVLLTGARSDIRTGNFTLNRAMTGKDILHSLTTSSTDERQVKVTIVEGATNTEIAAQLEKAGVISATDFLAAAGKTDSRLVVPGVTYDFLSSKPSSVDLEGFLFPDTYYFFKQSSAAPVLKKILDNFGAKYSAALRQGTLASGRMIFQEVTMASILEAELRTSKDRAMAADIFWRRLDAGAGLNADATVLYALGRSTGSLTNADLQIASPYNTYRNKGLPAGPIGNPGLGALRAAISPVTNDYWYYLSAPDGKTIFATTLEEHNRNKATYLK